jgi:hypothetical protein
MTGQPGDPYQPQGNAKAQAAGADVNRFDGQS